MNIRRAIFALGAACALSFGLMLAPSQADAATLTINSRANAVEAGQVLAAPDGSVFTITVYDAGLISGQKAVTHTYVTGNTLRQTANKIVQAINADSELQAIGVTATLGTGANYTINSTSTTGTLYKQTTTGGGSNRLAIQQTLTIGGTVTVDDKVTLTIYDAGLVGGKEAVVYKPVSGDSTATIVTRLRNKINNSTTLATLGISAKTSPTDASVLLIDSATFDATERFTSYSVKLNAGATETAVLGAFWGTNGAQAISVTGTVTVGEIVKFTVVNSDLPDSQKEVSYEVQSGDTLNKIRCGLRTEINNDADLAEIGVHATCAGGVINLTANSTSPVAYFGISPKKCEPVSGNPRVKLCFPASAANAALVKSTVETILSNGTDGAQKLQTNNLITWYVYANHDDYYNSGSIPFFNPTGGPNALTIRKPLDSDVVFTLPKVLGYTLGGPFGYSAIFDTSLDLTHGISSSITNNYVAHAAAHETGHHLDRLYTGGGISGPLLSESAEFRTALERDIAGINAVQACAYNATDGHGVFGDPPERTSGIWASADPHNQTIPLPTGGLGGLFSGAIAANGTEMCNDRTPNFSGSNFEKIKAAYPYFEAIKGKNPGDPELQVRELFAEEYAYEAGFPDTIDNSGNTINGSNNVFNTGAFVCTRLFVRTWTTHGRAPNADELRSVGYSVPDIVPAGDPDAGAFGFGERNHYCDGTIGELGHYGFGS